MLPEGKNEEILYRAVLAGWIEVRQDGSIWRIAQRRKSRWDGSITVKAVKPHRIDAAVGKGYRTVKIMVDGIQTSCPAHRLVWRVLKGRIPKGLTINHQDGKKARNVPSNLEPATCSEQMLHAYRTGLKDEHGETNPAAKLTDLQIAQIRERYLNGLETQAEIGQVFGVAFQTISKIVRGESRPRQLGVTGDYTSRRRRGILGRDSRGRFI